MTYMQLAYMHLATIVPAFLIGTSLLYSVPAAFINARRGDVQAHRRAMVGLYIGGMLIAGSFAFMPGRLLHRWLF
jgi:uncharacterized membrane protein